jgi:hypothetical protein
MPMQELVYAQLMYFPATLPAAITNHHADYLDKWQKIDICVTLLAAASRHSLYRNSACSGKPP